MKQLNRKSIRIGQKFPTFSPNEEELSSFIKNFHRISIDKVEILIAHK